MSTGSNGNSCGCFLKKDSFQSGPAKSKSVRAAGSQYGVVTVKLNSNWEMRNSIEAKKAREFRRERERKLEEMWRRDKERKEAAVKILELKGEGEVVEEEEVTKKREMELRLEREWLDLLAGPGLDDFADLTLVEVDWGLEEMGGLEGERKSRDDNKSGHDGDHCSGKA